MIALFLFLAFMSFSVALVVCILLSTTYGQPSMVDPVPQMFFAMSGFLIISAILFGKGMTLWFRERARRNAIALELSDAKEIKVDGYIVEVVEKPKYALITK